MAASVHPGVLRAFVSGTYLARVTLTGSLKMSLSDVPTSRGIAMTLSPVGTWSNSFSVLLGSRAYSLAIQTEGKQLHFGFSLRRGDQQRRNLRMRGAILVHLAGPHHIEGSGQGIGLCGGRRNHGGRI